MLCCTASILHLVAIALDRFWAITRVDYAAKRTSKRITTMIAIIWVLAAIISVLPHLFGLSYDNTKECRLTDNLPYQLVSTLGAFYLPLIVMCVIYWRIFQSAKFRIRKKAFDRPGLKIQLPKNENSDQQASGSSYLIEKKFNGSDANVNNAGRLTNSESCISVVQTGHQGSLNSQTKKNKPNRTTSFRAKFHKFLATFSLPQHLWHTENHMAPNEDKYDGLAANGSMTSKDCFDNDLYVYTTDLINFYDSNLYASVPIALPESDILSTSSVFESHDNLKFACQRKSEDASARRKFFYLLNNFKSVSDYNFQPNGEELIDMNPKFSSGSKFVAMQNHKIPEDAIVQCVSSVIDVGALPGQKINQTVSPLAKYALLKNSQIVKSATSMSINQMVASTGSLHTKNQTTTAKSIVQSKKSTNSKKRNAIDIKRERKAAKTLGIIMSCFILCWLPFFIMQIIFAICKEFCWDDHPMVTLLTWLGYLNSLLNPIIYTIFSPDFRQAFAKILFGKYRKKHRSFHPRHRQLKP